MKGRWLITGVSGQLGGAIAKSATANGAAVICPDRHQLDLANPESIRAMVGSGNINGVVNCAAYTAVDRAESEPDIALAINAIAPKILADECAKLKIPLLHVSTDYVFNGEKLAPYIEEDPVGPLGVYGLTKEAGERAIRASGVQHAIIRTAWLLNSSGSNFLTTMLRLAAERDELRVVSDQIGCPTSVEDLANALIVVTERLGDTSGTWHFANNGQASWYELAKHIFSYAEVRGSPGPRLTPIATSDYPTPAKRPQNSRLSSLKFQRDFGLKPRPWQNAVDGILADRLS